MKINVTAILKDLAGKSLVSSERICAACKRPIEPVSMTVRVILINSLLGEVEGEKLQGTEKLRRFRLASQIQSMDEQDFTADEVVLLKEQVNKFYTALVVGQVWDLLDPPKSSEAR